MSGSSFEGISEKLQEHLKQLPILTLFNNPLALQIKQATLSIAYKENPEDFILLGQLIKAYIEMEEIEKAMVLAEKLEYLSVNKQDWLQLGNALLFQSEILIRNNLFELSSNKLNLAIEQFVKIDDLKRQAKALFVQSWLDHQNGDYLAIKASLLESAKLSFDITDIRSELDALTYLSIMAHKHNQDSDKYFYLHQAENKLKEYKLPSYHLSVIPFHYAIFAKDVFDKEPHYKQVLELSKLAPNYWTVQKSRKALMKQYMKQKRFKEAQELVDSLTSDNIHNSYLRTLLAQAKGKSVAFNKYAKLTFEQARLAGNKELSLDVALLILNTPNSPVNYEFYSKYIYDNSTDKWINRNKDKLSTFNF